MTAAEKFIKAIENHNSKWKAQNDAREAKREESRKFYGVRPEDLDRLAEDVMNLTQSNYLNDAAKLKEIRNFVQMAFERGEKWAGWEAQN